MGFPKWVDEQSKGMKILLTKETATLIGMILFVIPFTGFILSIVDLVFIITEDKIKLFVPGGENFGINGTVSGDEETKDDSKDDKEEKSE